jgi:hypothetical protein
MASAGSISERTNLTLLRRIAAHIQRSSLVHFSLMAAMFFSIKFDDGDGFFNPAS